MRKDTILNFSPEGELAAWNPDGSALEKIKEFVQDVTCENSPHFIPARDRVAVFDFDGTLYGENAPTFIEWWMFYHRVMEDPTYDAPEDVVNAARKIYKVMQTKTIPEGMEKEHAAANAKAYAGMTLEEYRQYVLGFAAQPAECFNGLTHAQAWYIPMVELVDYLTANGFSVFTCSGTDRFMCRILSEGVVDIPFERFIGMDVTIAGSGQGDTDCYDYIYSPEDELIRTDGPVFKPFRISKVALMAREIGRRPVLCFGNSIGDESMALYVTRGNKYRSEAFMLLADDAVREYGNEEKAAVLRERWEALGWKTISMRDDFLTIYGEGVTRQEHPALLDADITE